MHPRSISGPSRSFSKDAQNACRSTAAGLVAVESVIWVKSLERVSIPFTVSPRIYSNNAGSPATTTSPASVGSVGSSGSGTEQGKGGSGTAGAAVAAQKPSAHTTKSGHSLQVSPSNPNRSNVTIPHNVAQMTLQHFTVMNFILKSQQLWTQSEEMERSCNGVYSSVTWGI